MWGGQIDKRGMKRMTVFTFHLFRVDVECKKGRNTTPVCKWRGEFYRMQNREKGEPLPYANGVASLALIPYANGVASSPVCKTGKRGKPLPYANGVCWRVILVFLSSSLFWSSIHP